MNDRFIRSVSIDWSQINPDSYLHNYRSFESNEISGFSKECHVLSILLGIPGADIISFDNGTVTRCSYEETESYQVTEMFINHRKQLTERLLSESEEEGKPCSMGTG